MSKSFFSLVTILKTIKLFDLYGQNINLLISKQKKFSTAGSGIISIIIIIFIVEYYRSLIYSWLGGENKTLIFSEVSHSINELLGKNKSISYQFDYTNYYFFFSMRVRLADGSFVQSDLRKFVSTDFSYLNQFGKAVPLKNEACKIKYQDIYLGLNEETINHDENKTNPYYLCIGDQLEMGIYPDTQRKVVNLSLIYFSINQCVNSSANNNSCAPKDEIINMMKHIQVLTSIPKTIYDFQSSKPNTNVYDYHVTNLDPFLSKNFYNAIIPTFLVTDKGLVNDYYSLDETNFNPDITYDPQVREESDKLLFRMAFGISMNEKIYRQKQNIKLNDIIGNMGGYLNFVFMLGKILCFTYNGIHLRIKIIKHTFEKNISSGGTSPLFKSSPKNIDNFHFSGHSVCNHYGKKILNYFWPNKETREFYEKGSKRLHEYLDICKIIKRLQDIDKMKIILFNEQQRRTFENIPKPDIMNKSEFSLDNLLKYSGDKKQKVNNSTKLNFNKNKEIQFIKPRKSVFTIGPRSCEFLFILLLLKF